MSSFADFLPVSPLRSPGPRSSEHELPTLSPNLSPQRSNDRSSTRSSNFSPPAPISASLFRPRQTSQTGRKPEPVRIPDSIVALRRQEKAVEEELQQLLDAQSDGLFTALKGPPVDGTEDASSTGTSTPTYADSMRREQEAPSDRYRPQRKIRSLRGARHGISRAISKLVAVKEHEAALVEESLQSNASILAYISGSSTKQSRLQKKIDAIEHASSAKRAEDIQHEARKLEAEIQETELRLRQMKAQHRRLLEEAAVTENSVQSKLSSYKASLSLLEADIQSFLARPPARTQALEDAPSTFYKLPKGRRTLAIARENWTTEHTLLEEKCRAVLSDRDSLVEGATVWRTTLSQITQIETALRAWLHQKSTPSPKPPSDPKGKAKTPHNTSTSTSTSTSSTDPDTAILQLLNSTITSLETTISLAERKNWTLLVAAVGAELEALRQGVELIRGSLLPADADTQELGPDSVQTSMNIGVPVASQGSIYLSMDGTSEARAEVREQNTQPTEPRRNAESKSLVDTDEDTDPQHLLTETKSRDTDEDADPGHLLVETKSRDTDSDPDGPGPLFLTR